MLMMMYGVRRLVLVQLTFVFVSLLIMPSESGYERWCSLDDRGYTRGICGPQLSSALATLCNGHYNGKRSMSDEPGAISLGDGDTAFVNKRMASSFLQYKRTYHPITGDSLDQGIVCECCIHRCDIAELMGYCAQPQPSKRGKAKAQLLGLDGNLLA